MARAPGLIRRRGQGWNVQIRVDGRKHEFGPRKEKFLRHAKTRADVEEWTWRKHAELVKQAKREAAGAVGRMRFSELLDEYERDQLPRLAENTRKTYSVSIAAFRAYFVNALGDPDLDRIRPPHVRQFLRWREDGGAFGKPVGARSLVKDRVTLGAIFGYACRDLEVLDANPVDNVKPPKTDARTPVILTPEQYEALITAAGATAPGRKPDEAHMLQAYVLVLGEAGLRCDSEALWLRWTDLDFEGGFLWIESSAAKGRRTKGGRSRWVPMTPRLRQALREHALRFRGRDYHGATSPWVFHHPHDRRRAKAGARAGRLGLAFAGAVERANAALRKAEKDPIPADLHQHDLRHCRVTWWLAEGKDVVLVKEALGHADLRTTMGYQHLAREHLRGLVEDRATPSRDLAPAGG
jgi:integrase/recombinase XerD